MNHKRQLLYGIITLSFFGALSFYVHTAAAYTINTVTVEQKNDFVLEPGKAEIDLNPGDSVVRNITVTDRIPGSTSFKVEVEDIEGSNDPNTPVVVLQPGEKGPNSGKDFIQPDTTNFTLTFGQQITIPVTIAIPKDASPGGYYSSVLISNEPAVDNVASTTGAQGITKVISRVGTLLFIRVNGTADVSGQLQSFEIKGPHSLSYAKGPFTFEILFNNNGNVHLVPYGTITIKNMLGKPVASLPVDAYFSLPNSLRYRDIAWDSPMLLGRYTATLTLNRGYDNKVDTQTIAFWVIPWKLVGIIFGALLIISLIIVFFFRTFELRKK